MFGLSDAPVDLNKLTVSIQRHEGLRLFPYTDTTGNTTIGYGRNLSGKGISNGEATALLQDDINDAITLAESQVWWPMVVSCEPRARALIEMLFNLGLGGFNTFKSAISALESGDFETAAADFLNSEWANQVGNRAQELTQMIATGEDFSPQS